MNIDQLYLHEDDFALKLWNTTRTSLNSSQIKAIQYAVGNRFQLIQGPPGKNSEYRIIFHLILTGTGKSVVGAHLIYIFSKMNAESNKCVLYCCPSNKAVDVVHSKYAYIIR